MYCSGYTPLVLHEDTNDMVMYKIDNKIQHILPFKNKGLTHLFY